MRLTTITRALAALPATRAELAAALGVGQVQAGCIAKYMIDNRYAEEWGTKLTDKGTLAPVLQVREPHHVS